MLEIDARQPLIDHDLEIARIEFNNLLKDARAQETMFHLERYGFYASWFYIALFCAVLTRHVRLRHREEGDAKRRNKAEDLHKPS
jgi:hypothetical protein